MLHYMEQRPGILKKTERLLKYQYGEEWKRFNGQIKLKSKREQENIGNY